MRGGRYALKVLPHVHTRRDVGVGVQPLRGLGPQHLQPHVRTPTRQSAGATKANGHGVEEGWG